jgi:predicted nuclease with TOPRIM domain
VGYYVHQQQQRADNERAVAEERRLNIVALNEKVKTLEQAKVEAVVAQRQQTVDVVAQREANAAMKTRIAVLEADTQRFGASIAALRDGNRSLEASIERHELEHGFLEDRIKALDESITMRRHQGEAHWERAGQLKPLPDILAAQGEALSRRIDALTRQESDLKRLVRQSWPCDTVEPVELLAPQSMALPMGFNPPRKALAAAPPVPSDPGDSMRLRARIDELARELAALLGERARLADEASWLRKEAALLQQQQSLLTEEAARLKGVELTLRQRRQALGVALARAEAERQSQLAWIAQQEIADANALSYLVTAQKEHDRLESRTIAESSQIGGKQQKVEKLQDLVRSHTANMNPFVESLARAARNQAARDLAAMLAVKAYRWAPFDTDDPDKPLVYNTLWSVLRQVDPAAALALVAPDNLAAGKLATTRSEVMVTALCSRVGRPFTQQEWVQFMGPACFTPQAAKVCEP